MLRNFIREESSVCGKWFLILFTLIVTFATQALGQNDPSGSSPEKGPTEKQSKGTIRLAIPELEATYLYRFSVLKFNEAFSRLGYGFELHSLPSERALVESNSGRMDGEAGRIQFDSTMAAKYPNLVEVNEPTFTVIIGAYSADASIRLSGWKDLEERKLVIGYPRGIKAAEKRLVGYVDENVLHSVTNIRQGLMMLRNGRIDVLLGLQTSVESVLDEVEFVGSGIALIGIMEVVKVFPYLHKKHHALAPQLAAILRAMKKDGTLDRLAEEAKKSIKLSVDQK